MVRYLPLLCLLLISAAASAADSTGTSRSTFLKLMEVQELWNVDDYDTALTVLQELSEKTVEDNYDFAITQQYIAHTAMLSDRNELAMPALKAALAREGLPPDMIASLKLSYGQLVLAEEDFELARNLLEEWLAITESEPLPAQIFSLGYANFMTDRLPRAEELLERAINSSNTINNTWYRVYYQALFDQKKYDKAEGVIYTLTSRDPGNDNYWALLANHYVQVEDGKRAAAAMAISYLQDLLEQPSDLRRLAAMYGYIEAPEKAARLLEGWVEEGRLEGDPETLRRLGDLWLLARERGRAMEYLDRAAAVAPDGQTYELLASLHFEDEAWEEAYRTFARALDAGGLKEAERVHLLAGISAYRAGMKDEARASLEAAARSDKHRSQAQAMLRRVNES